MITFKRAKVVMLPTQKVSHFGFLTARGVEQDHLVYFSMKTPIILDSVNCHLYITNDDEIRLNDYVIHENKISRVTGFFEGRLQLNDNVDSSIHKDYCKKVIATTDELTNYSPNCFSLGLIRQIPLKFVFKYVNSYATSRIEEVEIKFVNDIVDCKSGNLCTLRKIQDENKNSFLDSDEKAILDEIKSEIENIKKNKHEYAINSIENFKTYLLLKMDEYSGKLTKTDIELAADRFIKLISE